MSSLQQNRLAVSLLVFLGWLMIGWMGGPLLQMLGDPTIMLGDMAIPGQLLGAVIFVIAMSALFDPKEVGLSRPISGKLLMLSWLPLIYIVAFLVLAVIFGPPSLSVALPFLITATLGSVSQEVMFRGILLAGLRSCFSVLGSVWISSALAGLAWLPVWLWYGAWERAIFDGINSVFLGLLFCALRIRMGSLYPAIILHAAWSYGLILLRVVFYGDPWTSLIFTLAILPLPVYGLFLLRRRALAKIPMAVAA